jgi:hypothetical protein
MYSVKNSSAVAARANWIGAPGRIETAKAAIKPKTSGRPGFRRAVDTGLLLEAVPLRLVAW